jgi:penicillin-binding protein 1A
VQPRGIIQVIDGDGGTAYDNPAKQDRVISPDVAFQMVSMLEDVVDRGTAAAARTTYGVRFPAAGKTGTTDDFKDAWFVGFTSSIVAGVWVGEDQPASIGREGYGARYALPIWSAFMRAAARQRPAQAFDPPQTLRQVQLCDVSYLRPVEGCPVYTEYFKDGDDIPTRLCPIHQGSVRQELRRAVQGLFSTLGKRIWGVFRR